MIYADYRNIDAQINHILNRSPEGVFSAVGDTSASADARYNDDAVTEARRKAAYRIFEAIGSNPSHPFWGELMDLVEVGHDEIIPAYYGEIGIPVISPFPKSSYAHGALVVRRSAVKATGYLTVVAPAAAYAAGYLDVLDPIEFAEGSLTFGQGVPATGIWTFSSNPINGEIIVVNGVTFTFVTGVSDLPTEVVIGENKYATAANFVAVLNLSTNPLISVATYSSSTYIPPPITGGGGHPPGFPVPAPPQIVTITYDSFGEDGNDFTLANSSDAAILRGSATLTGGENGLVDGETLNLNGASLIFVYDLPDVIEDTIDGEAGTQYLKIYDDPEEMAASFVDVMEVSTNPNLNVANYSADGSSVNIQYGVAGTIGNTYLLFESSEGSVTRSGTALTGGLGGVVEGETLDVNGVTFVFSNFVRGATYIPFSDSSVYTATQISAKLNASVNGAISVATYTYDAPDSPDDVRFSERILIQYDTAGLGGNAFTLSNSSYGDVTRSGDTLAGGTVGLVNGETININTVVFTFNGTGAGANEILIGATTADTATNMAVKLNAHANGLISAATYTPIGGLTDSRVSISYDTFGITGNLYALHNSSANSVVASDDTLTGGIDGIVESETLNVDGEVFTFKATPVAANDVDFSSSAVDNTKNLYAKLVSNPSITTVVFARNGNTIDVDAKTAGTTGNSFALHNSSGTGVTATAMSGGLDVEETYITGYPADADLIDAWRNNGSAANFFSQTPVAHNESIGNGLPNPIACRYNTNNSVLKFTGYRAKVPMIVVPEDDDADLVVQTGTCETTFESSFIESTSEDMLAAYLGMLLVVEFDGVEVARGTITEIVDSTTVSIAPEEASATVAADDATFTIYNVTDSEAELMADTRIPMDLAALNVKLALQMLMKEGDNNFRLCQTLGSEGERDLMMLKAGAIKVAPIDLVKMGQVGQKWNG